MKTSEYYETDTAAWSAFCDIVGLKKLPTDFESFTATSPHSFKMKTSEMTQVLLEASRNISARDFVKRVTKWEKETGNKLWQ